jgi:hypothetical protein
MTHDRQDDTNIERRQDLQHDEEAFRLRQEEKRLRTARLNTPFVWISSRTSDSPSCVCRSSTHSRP